VKLTLTATTAELAAFKNHVVSKPTIVIRDLSKAETTAPFYSGLVEDLTDEYKAKIGSSFISVTPQTADTLDHAVVQLRVLAMAGMSATVSWQIERQTGSGRRLRTVSYTLGADTSLTSGSRSSGFEVLPAVRQISPMFARAIHEIYDSNNALALEAAAAAKLGDEFTQLKGAIVKANKALAGLSSDASLEQKADADQALEDALDSYNKRVKALVDASRAKHDGSRSYATSDTTSDTETEEEKEEDSSEWGIGIWIAIVGGSVAVLAAIFGVLVCVIGRDKKQNNSVSSGSSVKFSRLSTNDLWDRNRFAPSF
jgi:hypothetical protein